MRVESLWNDLPWTKGFDPLYDSRMEERTVSRNKITIFFYIFFIIMLIFGK